MTQEEFHKRYQYNPTTDCLGEGGFGKVYKAYDTHRDRWVAIKMAEVKPHLEEVRLKKEVEMISKLPSHPNIAYYEECYTFSSFTGEYDFGILQYYDQGNLEQLLSAKQLTESQKESILRQLLEGIAFLHSQGIIHRDLKPQNILIVNRNGEYIPKITDFGISKKLDASKSSVFTNSLAGAGTLVYASPEQLCGQTIKKNTDLWSFGVMACRVLLGKLPFEIGSHTITSEAGRIELYKKITQGELASYIQQLSPIWYDLVKRCLVVDNKVRVGSAAECLGVIKKSNSQNVVDSKENTEVARFPSKPNVDNESIDIKNDSKRESKGKIILFGCVILVLLFWGGYIYWSDGFQSHSNNNVTTATSIDTSSVLINAKSATNIDSENEVSIRKEQMPVKDISKPLTEDKTSDIAPNTESHQTVDISSSNIKSRSQPYIQAEVMPEFPGGVGAMMRFLGNNIQYPVFAQKNNISGTVLLTFVVDENGSISDVKILRGIGGGCDEEAIRVVKLMPNWKPGMQSGENVPVLFNLPIRFSLN